VAFIADENIVFISHSSPTMVLAWLNVASSAAADYLQLQDRTVLADR
jgi:hypothetical protein